MHVCRGVRNTQEERAGCGAPVGRAYLVVIRVLHRLLPYCPKSHRACPRLRRRRCFTAPPPKLHLCRKQGWEVEVREVSGHAKHLAASQKGAARNQSATLRCATLILWRCRNGGIPLTAQEWGSSVAALALARGVGRMRCVWAVPPIGVTMTCVTSSLAMYSRPC